MRYIGKRNGLVVEAIQWVGNNLPAIWALLKEYRERIGYVGLNFDFMSELPHNLDRYKDCIIRLTRRGEGETQAVFRGGWILKTVSPEAGNYLFLENDVFVDQFEQQSKEVTGVEIEYELVTAGTPAQPLGTNMCAELHTKDNISQQQLTLQIELLHILETAVANGARFALRLCDYEVEFVEKEGRSETHIFELGDWVTILSPTKPERNSRKRRLVISFPTTDDTRRLPISLINLSRQRADELAHMILEGIPSDTTIPTFEPTFAESLMLADRLEQAGVCVDEIRERVNTPYADVRFAAAMALDKRKRPIGSSLSTFAELQEILKEMMRYDEFVAFIRLGAKNRTFAKIKDLPDSFLRFIIAFGVFDEDSIPKGTLSVHRKNIMKLGKMLYNVRVKPHTTEPVLPLQYTRATYEKIASFVGMLAKFPGF